MKSGRWVYVASVVVCFLSCRAASPSAPPTSVDSDAGREVDAGISYSIDDVGRLMSTETCISLKRCIGEDLFHLYMDADFSNCEKFLRAEFEVKRAPLLREALARGRVALPPAQVDAALTALRTLSCDAFSIDDTTFARVFQGLVADGAPCILHEECGSTSFCQKKSVCPGVCTPRQKADPSALCQNDSRECAADAYCSGGTCRKVVRLDEACDDDARPCPGLSQCLGDTVTGGSGRTCKTAEDFGPAFVGRGQACGAQLCQAPWVCAYDVTRQADVCMAKKNVGETCTTAQLMNSCPTGAFCAGIDRDANDFEGTCETLRGVNQPCIPSEDSPCAEGLYCSSGGSCVDKKSVGASCTEAFECQSGLCQQSTCAKKIACSHSDLG